MYLGIRQIIDEMIYNLCENAIKYNIEGGKVSVWAGNTLEGPKVIVTDTGIGIPKSIRNVYLNDFTELIRATQRRPAERVLACPL